MDRLEAVEIRLSEAKIDNDETRIDSEFFKKNYLIFNKLLDKIGSRPIGHFATVTDGIHTSIDFDNNSTINSLSAKSPKNNVFDLSANGYISEKQHLENPRTSLKEDDIIISTVGTIGNCAVVDKSILPANCDRHVGIIRIKEDYYARYLSTFLLSKYGYLQSTKYSTGNVQLNLFIYKIKNIKVPFISDVFQQQIENTVLKAHSFVSDSRNFYFSAEKLLLSHLGLDNYTPNCSGIAIKSLSESFGATGRLDSEYYLPKYEELEEHLNEYTAIKLCELAQLQRGSFISEEFYDETKGTMYIRGKDITGNAISHKDAVFINEQFIGNNETTINEGDLVFAQIGSVGEITLTTREFENTYISNNLGKITITSDIKPEYLLVYLKSYIGKMLFEKYLTRTSQPKISTDDMGNFLIPIIPIDIQSQITEKVQESFVLRKKSTELLELAKTAVEVAIEQGEEKAMQMLQNQI